MGSDKALSCLACASSRQRESDTAAFPPKPLAPPPSFILRRSGEGEDEWTWERMVENRSLRSERHDEIAVTILPFFA